MKRILDASLQEMLAAGLNKPYIATILNRPMARIVGYDDYTEYPTYEYPQSPVAVTPQGADVEEGREGRELHAASDMDVCPDLKAFQKKEHTQFNVPSRRDNIHNGPPGESDSVSEDDKVAMYESDDETEYELPAQKRKPPPPVEEEHTQAMRDHILVSNSTLQVQVPVVGDLHT